MCFVVFLKRQKKSGGGKNFLSSFYFPSLLDLIKKQTEHFFRCCWLLPWKFIYCELPCRCSCSSPSLKQQLITHVETELKGWTPHIYWAIYKHSFLPFSPSSMVKLSINQQFFMIIRRFLGFVLKGFTRKNFLLSNVDGWTDPAWARRVSSSQARGRALDGATIELNPGCKKLLQNGKKNIISCFFRLLWIFILGSIFFYFFPLRRWKGKERLFSFRPPG